MTVYLVMNSCVEKYTCAQLFGGVVAIYDTLAVAEAHVAAMNTWDDNYGEPIWWGVVPTEVQSSLDATAVQSFNFNVTREQEDRYEEEEESQEDYWDRMRDEAERIASLRAQQQAE